MQRNFMWKATRPEFEITRLRFCGGVTGSVPWSIYRIHRVIFFGEVYRNANEIRIPTDDLPYL